MVSMGGQQAYSADTVCIAHAPCSVHAHNACAYAICSKQVGADH